MNSGAVLRASGWLLLSLGLLGCPPGVQPSSRSPATVLYDDCEAGTLEACMALAGQYEDGSAPAPDATRMAPLFEHVCKTREPFDPAACAAAALYARACDGGIARACEAYGLVIASGKLDKRRAEEAEPLFQRACLAGQRTACLRVGARHLAREEYRRAVELFSSGCDDDHGPSCRALADMVARGLGVAPSLERAVSLHKRACVLDEQASCVDHGKALMHGHGVEQVPAAALGRFELACRRGEAAGCVEMGRAVEHGRGTKADPAQAFDYYRRAANVYGEECDAGHAGACSALGGLMREGSGVPRDESAGLELQRRACERDEADACIAFMSRGRNLVVEGKELRIIDRLAAACVRGHAMACFMIGRMGPVALRMAREHMPAGDAMARGCRLGVGAACNALALTDFPPVGPARGSLERACALGDAPGCHHLAEVLSLPGKGQDSERALSLYERACHWRHGPACARWGTLLSRGEGGEVDPEKAALVFRLGCDFGSADACYDLGVMRQEGTRVSGDPVAGARYLELACKLGANQACARIGLRQVSGKGGAPDKAAGRRRLDEACREGHAGACVDLADMLRGGNELPRDDALAVKYYEMASARAAAVCDASISYCRNSAPARGVKMRWGRWHGQPARLLLAHPSCDDRMERSCGEAADAAAGRCALDGQGCFAAAQLLRRLEQAGLGPGATRADELSKRGVAEAKKRCERGAGAACEMLARAYREGDGAKKSPTRAEQFQRRACTLEPARCQQ